jgi:DNA-binding NarL/FixJ family response regulator
MPRVNGLTAAAAILATRPAARVVFVSVLDNRAVINRALNCGALGYVLKSDVGNELLAAVRQAIDGRRYVSTNARLAIARTGGAGAKDDGRG